MQPTAIDERCRAARPLLRAAGGVLLALLCGCGGSGGGGDGGGSGASRADGALALVSRGMQVYASSAQHPAGDAADADYNTVRRSAGVPATLSFDVSPIPAERRRSLLLVWYNDATYGYDHAVGGYPGYDNPGAYTIEANAAGSGGAPPGNGWVTLAQIGDNTRHSRQHLLDLSRHSWLRLNFSASDGSDSHTDIAINVDLYAVAGAVDDGWFFAGDSLTGDCMGHGDLDGARAPAFGTLIRADNPPPQENAGMPAWTSRDLLVYLDGWLADFPGRYVTLNLGSNDAISGMSPSQFRLNLSELAQKIREAGKVPLLPTIPYSSDPSHQARIPAFNAEIRALQAEEPGLLAGPDLYAYYEAHPDLLAADGVHLNDAGCAAYRRLWADRARSAVYGLARASRDQVDCLIAAPHPCPTGVSH